MDDLKNPIAEGLSPEHLAKFRKDNERSGKGCTNR